MSRQAGMKEEIMIPTPTNPNRNKRCFDCSNRNKRCFDCSNQANEEAIIHGEELGEENDKRCFDCSNQTNEEAIIHGEELGEENEGEILIPTPTNRNCNQTCFYGSNKANGKKSEEEEENEDVFSFHHSEGEEENFAFNNPYRISLYPQLFRAVLTPREFPPPPPVCSPDDKQSPLRKPKNDDLGEEASSLAASSNGKKKMVGDSEIENQTPTKTKKNKYVDLGEEASSLAASSNGKKKMVGDSEIENQTPTKTRKNKYVWPKIDDKSKPKKTPKSSKSSSNSNKKNPKASTTPTDPPQTCPVNPETLSEHMCPVTPSVVQESSRKPNKTCRRALHFDSDTDEKGKKEKGTKGKKRGKKGCIIDFENMLVPRKKRSKLAIIDSLINKFLSLSCNEIEKHTDDQIQECQCPNCCSSRTGAIMKSLSKKQQKVVDTSLVPYQEKEKLAMTLFKKNLVPKADIDRETIKIWDLLIMGGEIPEDERTKAWWEKEKKSLYGNIEMFISCMRMIQGDRMFSRWKGSVVDSVIGVFLTQNVSDALSSSAFMALAAKFPVKSHHCNENNEDERDIKEDSNKKDEKVKKWEELNQQAKKWEEELRKDYTPRKEDPNILDPNRDTNGEAVKRKKWEELKKKYSNGRPRDPNTLDSVDWEAVRRASFEDVAEPIRERGQSTVLSIRIKLFLDRIAEFHGSIDLEWLRYVPPNEVKEYLMDIRGIGLKSVECIRLLCLEHHAFPVDTNVGRIAVRLGWVPLQPLPENIQIHELKKYPLLNGIQKYLWARLHDLSQRQLYELHYHMITFGKVFCTKVNPNCNVCPFKKECKHFASAFASAKLQLPGPNENARTQENNVDVADVFLLENNNVESRNESEPIIELSQPIIELPQSPKPEIDIEDLCLDDDNNDGDYDDGDYDDESEIPTIVLNSETFRQNMLALQNGEMSNSLVVISPEAASFPPQRLMSLGKLRSVHQVYELDDECPILEGFEKREPEDPCRYLFRMWTTDEADYLVEEYNDQMVLGSILVPSRSANRGSFPLNGTYFQPNEVFADYESSHNPIAVSRELLWNKPMRTLYCGTTVTSIHRGFTQLSEVKLCCSTGYYCIRGFERKTRAPRPLPMRFHRPRETGNKGNKKSTTKNKENNIGEEDDM